MMDSVADWLFDPSGLTAHGFCLLWEPSLIWVHAVSDSVVGLAYFSIPLALFMVARRRPDLGFRRVLWLFVAFILLCGAGHWLDLTTLWIPIYGIEGVVKAATAVFSILTAGAMWLLLPQVLTLPSPAQMQRANAALRESEARTRSGFEQSPVPLHTLDRSGIITGVSDSWLELLGYERAEVVGHHVKLLETPDQEIWRQDDCARLMAAGEIRELDRRFRRKDGEAIETLVSARVERSGDAMVIVCVVIDITARRRAEEALRVTEERLRQAQKMEAIGQLTGGVAHDFNNMLQGIGGCLDLMERRLAQGRGGEVGRYLPPARQAVTRAARLTSRMLAFARRQTLQPRPVDPDALVLGMEELIRQTVGPSVAVVLDLHDGVWSILCDPHQLESVLLNLAINARDAMPDGGTLRISTADIAISEADLAGHEDAAPGQYIAISVADSGTGMPASVIARMFDPFFTTKPIGQGSGLGLSQVYGFVRQSGGFIRVDSVEGEGSVLHVMLPRHEATPEADRLQEQAAAKQAGVDLLAAGARVLVAEDEDGLRAILVETLEEMGCIVQAAPDGTAGLAVVESDVKLDLLVTDVGMPGLNGRQLADAARVQRPGLPVLIITGYAGKALQDVPLPEGMSLIRKPFPLEDFTLRVLAMLDTAPRC